MNNLTNCMYDYRYERNSREPRKVAECAECGESLYEGEEVYVIGDKLYCNDCVRLTTLDYEDWRKDE